MNIKVCKFGGTSMAAAENINRVAEIILSDSARRYIIVSAPGKRFSGDDKITDLFYASYAEALSSGECGPSFDKIRVRFRALVDELQLKINIDKYLDEIEEKIALSVTPDYAASRGEYLSALILAAKLDYDFVDSADIIRFTEYGTLNSEYTNDLTAARLSKVERAVIPGFYGSMDGGAIKTFTRGGSDVSGAVIARAVRAEVYENWTDVDGFLTADPHIVENPRLISVLSYKELRELSYMGANVLHPDSTFPVRLCSIPINIRNTFNPRHTGTLIVPDTAGGGNGTVVTGIAGKKGFTSISIEKSMMNSETGFARRVLSVLEHCGICFEHLPSGIDTMSLFIADSELAGKLEKIINKIREAVNPDRVEVHSGISLIATVGHGMADRPGTAAKLFSALSAAGVNVMMIDQGSSGMNIIIGVENKDYERAVNAIYHAFF